MSVKKTPLYCSLLTIDRHAGTPNRGKIHDEPIIQLDLVIYWAWDRLVTARFDPDRSDPERGPKGIVL